MSEPLTFEELKVGDTFIGFPGDGDDSGHGGYRKGAWLLRKLAEAMLFIIITGVFMMVWLGICQRAFRCTR